MNVSAGGQRGGLQQTSTYVAAVTTIFVGGYFHKICMVLGTSRWIGQGLMTIHPVLKSESQLIVAGERPYCVVTGKLCF